MDTIFLAFDNLYQPVLERPTPKLYVRVFMLSFVNILVSQW